MWRRLTQIDSWIETTDFVVHQGRFWCLWTGGVECISVDSGQKFSISFPAPFHYIESAGTNGKCVIAFLRGTILSEEYLMCFSIKDAGTTANTETVVLERLQKYVVAISPYRHDCFNSDKYNTFGLPVYLYYHPSPGATMSVGEKYAVLANASSQFMVIGSGERTLGILGIPLMYVPVPLVGDVAVGCTDGEDTIIVAQDGILSFKAAGGMHGNLLALVDQKQEMTYVIDLKSLSWTSFPFVKGIAGELQRVFICPANGKHYIVCVEEVYSLGDRYLEVWGAEIPQMTHKNIRSIPVQYTEMSTPFAFK